MMPGKKEKTNRVKKKRVKVLRAFENNTLLLIFSLLCAAVIWFIMMATSGESRAVVVRNVPISIQMSETAQEAGIRIFDRSYLTADVSITGSSLITNKVTADDLEVTAVFDPSVTMLTGNSMQQASLAAARRQEGQHDLGVRGGERFAGGGLRNPTTSTRKCSSRSRRTSNTPWRRATTPLRRRRFRPRS